MKIKAQQFCPQGPSPRAFDSRRAAGSGVPRGEGGATTLLSVPEEHGRLSSVSLSDFSTSVYLAPSFYLFQVLPKSHKIRQLSPSGPGDGFPTTSSVIDGHPSWARGGDSGPQHRATLRRSPGVLQCNPILALTPRRKRQIAQRRAQPPESPRPAVLLTRRLKPAGSPNPL